jgi:hypothetical protein
MKRWTDDGLLYPLPYSNIRKEICFCVKLPEESKDFSSSWWIDQISRGTTHERGFFCA